MKYLKIIGLAAVAAMALMAFASTASATTLCKVGTETNGCATANDYPAETIIKGVSTGPAANGKAVLESGSIVLDECNSTIEGKTSTTSGTPLKGKISILSWTNCSVPTTTLATGELGIEWISGTDDGTVTGYGQQVTVTTGAFGTCTFGTSASTGTDLGTLNHSATATSPATMTIKTSVPLISNESGLCPSSATWTANYEVTSPKPLYVTN